MTSFMNVLVRVQADKAMAKLAQLRGGIAGVDSGMGKVNKREMIGDKHLNRMSKFGNQLQWTGRMLQYNFTLPILLAGAAATKFALDQEKAFVHVAKVYGDTQAAAAQFRKELGLGRQAAADMAEGIKTDELEALDRAFTALSNHYGVQKKEINEIAGAWAAAGASGAQLAESTRSTLDAMIIGDMKAADATRALISIQAQYNLNTKELNATLATFNSIENATGASMSDLITGMEKAAGVARSAGIETRQLAAYMAALVPATGTAATAGNALKTIISRLVAPTKESSQVMNLMGLEVDKFAWNAMTGTERIQAMAERFNDLSKAEKLAASSTIASRWQVNRFDVLMREVINTSGFYAKALDSSANAGENFARMQDELNTVLESNPRKLQRMMVIIQNAAVEVIQPLIPHIIYLAQTLAKAAQGFANLSPEVQKLVLFMLLALAAVGPVVRYFGALYTLAGVLGRGFQYLGLGIAKMLAPLGLVRKGFSALGPAAYKTLKLTGKGVEKTVLGFFRLAPIVIGAVASSIAALFQFVAASGVLQSAWAAFNAGMLALSAQFTAAWIVLESRALRVWAAMRASYNGLVLSLQLAFQTAWLNLQAVFYGRDLIMRAAWQKVSLVFAARGNGALVAVQAAFQSAWLTMQAVFYGRDIVLRTMWQKASWFLSYKWNLVQLRSQRYFHTAWLTLQAVFYGRDIILRTAWQRVTLAVTTKFNAILLAVQRAFQAAWLTLQAIFYGRDMILRAAWAKVSLAAQAAWNAASIALHKAWSAAYLIATTLWAAAGSALITAYYFTVSTIMKTWHAILFAIQVAFLRLTITAYLAFTKAVTVIWALMHRLQFLITAGFWKKMLAMTIRGATAVLAAMTGPWGIAAAIVIGILYVFRNQIAQIWRNITGDVGSVGDVFSNLGDSIMGVFRSLPQGVQGAMIAVVTVVRDAALAVYDWFSYINPFARHSPSLVENVTGGMREVNKQFSSLSKIKQYTSAAYAEIKRFGQLTKSLGVSAAAASQAEDRATLKGAGAGQALGSYNRLVGILNKLTPILNRLEGQMQTQQRVVDGWQAKVDEANRKLDVQQAKLDKLQGVLDGYQEKLSAAQDALSSFASTPLEGMREMEEQIFANQMAQLRLRDEMMRFEDVYGTFDQLKAKIDAINGAQEILRGTQSELRAAGAGSDILGQYDQELAKLDQQKDSYADAADKLADMQAALDALQRQAERLDLTKALKFDEMLHQIEVASNRMDEMPFEEIMAGIAGANAQIDKYGPKVDAATAAVAAQQAVVDRLTTSRDNLNAQLEREQAQLDRLKEKYDTVNDAIQAINSSLQDVVSNAGKVSGGGPGGRKGGKGGGSDYLSPGAQNFINAGNANFPDPGGKGLPGRSDWSSQVGDIDDFTKKLSKETSAAFGSLNPFAPIKEKAKQAWDWIKNKARDTARGVGDFFSNAFSGVSIGGGGGFGDFMDKLKGLGEDATEIIRDLVKPFKWAWDLLGPEIEKIGKGIWDGLKSIWEDVGPELAKFGDLIKPLGEALSNVWTVIKPILGVIVGAFLGIAKVVLSVIGEVIGPLLKSLGKIIGNIIQVIRGVFEVIIGLLTGDFSMVWKGIVDIVGGTFGAIWRIIEGAGKLIWNVVEGVVKGVWGFFTWLWDVLVGHSVVPDIIEGIKFWFNKLKDLAKWVWEKVLRPVWNFFVSAFRLIIAAIKLWWAGVKLAWNALKTAGVWFWDNVLKPIWNAFKDIWDKWIWPGIVAWWEGLKLAWAALKEAGTWIWENVLKPVYNSFKSIWNDYIKPGMIAWWERLKVAWGRLKRAGIWIWENVLKPVWNRFKNVWNDYIKPGLIEWWARIKRTWERLKALGTWVWENVLKPVWTKAKDLWNKVKEELGKWKARFEKAWEKLKDIGAWFKTNVMDPIFSKVTGGWERIRNWMRDNKDFLKEGAKGLVNGVIGAINQVIKGLNKVSDILPKVDWEIKLIPELAAGGPIPGRRGNRGFKTNGARAIVGEGKANHPEFVIPTDPTYRSRARSLLAQAASKIGIGDGHALVKNSGSRIGGVPAFKDGGVLSDAWDWTKDTAGSAGRTLLKGGENIVKTTMKPYYAAANGILGLINWGPARNLGRHGVYRAKQFTESLNLDANAVWKRVESALGAAGARGGNVNVADPANPRGRTNYKGHTFTNRFVSHLQAAERIAGVGLNIMQGGFRPTTSYSGTSHQGDAVDAQPDARLIRALRRVGIAAGDRTGLGNWGPHLHAVPGPQTGYAGGSAIWQYTDYIAKGGKGQALNSAWGLANGAIVKARRGGVSARIGEGLNDEAIVPLPRDYRSSLLNKGTDSGKKEIHFHGDLSFPNITDPADAETFIDNLVALAKD